jgi:TRAP-type C4-dicarboxylate transport system substrate-binding protein
MNFCKKAVLGSVAACMFLMASASMAQKKITINIAASHPTTNIWVWAMHNAFQPEVDRLLAEAGGEYAINWKEAYGGTLYKFSDTRAAVRDGITDIGMVGTVWENAAMPLQNVTYFTPFATTDHELLVDVFDTLTRDLPELRDAWTAQNMVYLSSLITDSYDIYSKVPIERLADLQNRRINAPGTSANWLRGSGATPVDGALTTYYTDIQTGVSDGTLSFASGIQPARVYEVAPHLTRLDFGAMYFGGVAANKRFFDRLPQPVQEAILQAGRVTSIQHAKHVTERKTTALEEMKKAGLRVVDISADEKAKLIAGLPNISAPWLSANGQPAQRVLEAYFKELRARGATPMRDWDKEQ